MMARSFFSLHKVRYQWVPLRSHRITLKYVSDSVNPEPSEKTP